MLKSSWLYQFPKHLFRKKKLSIFPARGIQRRTWPFDYLSAILQKTVTYLHFYLQLLNRTLILRFKKQSTTNQNFQYSNPKGVSMSKKKKKNICLCSIQIEQVYYHHYSLHTLPFPFFFFFFLFLAQTIYEEWLGKRII